MAVADTGREAARWFAQLLRRGPAGRQIVRVVLFGSTARDEATPDSDVDLLVVATGSLDRVGDACADTALETWMHWHKGIEPIIYCDDEVRHAAPSFVQSVLRSGEEVLTVADEELATQRAADHAALAEEYLASAGRIRGAGEIRVAADIAYNAAELAAKAMILGAGADPPASHSGVVNRFGELYVKSGRVPAELGRRLNRALQLRNRARYDVHARIGPEDADEALALATEMVRLARESPAGG